MFDAIARNARRGNETGPRNARGKSQVLRTTVRRKQIGDKHHRGGKVTRLSPLQQGPQSVKMNQRLTSLQRKTQRGLVLEVGSSVVVIGAFVFG